ncbi:MAG: glycosyltransferase family 39 protein, partial [Caldilineaceae bacterium]|nr:glycosyltransferase family 39 protein [Caldilineaceae bacterium]
SLWAVRDGWGVLWQRVADDVHPPLYFLLLRGWTLAVGEAPFAVRYLSAGIALVALALSYALGRLFFDRTTALFALIWLGSSGLWLYYTRETRMYTLVIALAALSFWTYECWLARPRARTALLAVALVNGAFLYTHYAAFFLIAAQVIHLLLVHPRYLPRYFQGALLTALVYLPWVPILLQQIAARPDGLNQTLIAVNGAILNELVDVYTGGLGVLLLLPYLFIAKQRVRQLPWAKLLLLLLWIAIPPALMLTINARGIALYEARYVIGLLPAIALLTAYGIRQVKWQPFALLLLLCVVSANLWSLRWIRPPKPPWQATMHTVVAARQATEPTLFALVEARGPEHYYANLLGLQNEWSIDLTPLRHHPDVIQA